MTIDSLAQAATPGPGPAAAGWGAGGPECLSCVTLWLGSTSPCALTGSPPVLVCRIHPCATVPLCQNASGGMIRSRPQAWRPAWLHPGKGLDKPVPVSTPGGSIRGQSKALQATHQGDWLLALRSGRFPPPVPPPAALLHRNPSDPAALAKTVTWGEESAPPLAFLVFPLIPIIARERGDSACAPASPRNVRESIVFVLTPKSS